MPRPGQALHALKLKGEDPTPWMGVGRGHSAEPQDHTQPARDSTVEIKPGLSFWLLPPGVFRGILTQTMPEPAPPETGLWHWLSCFLFVRFPVDFSVWSGSRAAG